MARLPGAACLVAEIFYPQKKGVNMLEKFGRTLLFAVFIVFVFLGAKMAIKVTDPYTRKFSPSLADALASA